MTAEQKPPKDSSVHKPLLREPPVLLHACKAFAIISIKPAKSVRPAPNTAVDEVVQLTTLQQCGVSSESEGLTRVDSSTLLYRSPAPALPGASPTCPVSPVPAPVSPAPPTSLRLRSQSDCAVGSPVKGILKRRSMGRSWSECSDGSTSMSGTGTGSAELALLCRCALDSAHDRVVPRFDCCAFAGDDCPGDCSAGINAQLSPNGGPKKSVTFSERVEQNIFRPGSSILGQRRKNQRKAIAKTRRRLESLDTPTLASPGLDNIDEDNCDEVESQHDEQDAFHHPTTCSYGPEPTNFSEHFDEQLLDDIEQELSAQQATEAKIRSDERGVSVESLAVEKYKGLVVVVEAGPALGRPSSVDSALGAESADEAVPFAGAGAALRTAGSSERKDSGVGEEDDPAHCEGLGLEEGEGEEAMRHICLRVCEAVISG